MFEGVWSCDVMFEGVWSCDVMFEGVLVYIGGVFM